MDEVANLADVGFEDAEGVRIRQHQPGDFARHGLLESGEVDASAAVGFEVAYLVARDGHARGIRAVRRVRYQNVLARLADVVEVGANHQQAGEFTLRARRRLERDGVEPGDFHEAARRLSENSEASLGKRLWRVRMVRRQTRELRYGFVDARVVFHGAGAQRIDSGEI